MNKANYKYLFVFCSCLFFLTTTRGQLANKGLVTAASNGVPTFVAFDEKHPVGSNEAEQVLWINLANNNPLISFSKTQEIIDKLGRKHEKYQQYYQGIKVEFAVYTVHYSPENKIIALSGEFAPIDTLSIIPTVNEEEALTTAETFLDSASTEFSVLEEMIISKNFNITENTYHLAYKFNINGQMVHVDAVNNIVMSSYSTIMNAANDACTRYSGTVQIATEFDGTNYILEDNTRGDGIVVYNNQDMQFLIESQNPLLIGEIKNIINFEDVDNDWCGGIWNNSNPDQDNAALDIFWDLQKIYDYFLQVHNRNSFDNQGSQIRAVTHVWFNNSQKNAYYIPTNGYGAINQPVMLFGDGMAWNDPNPDQPWASLDIVAHEFGHGISISAFGISPPNNTNSNNNEIGAISESLSDIWAAIIENWVVSNGLNDAPNDTDKDMWLLGEEFRTNPNFAPKGIRSMKSPKDPPFFHSDTYLYPAATWNTQSPHARGGVMNYWFYLLSEGGSGINDKGDSYNIQPIGIEKGADIIYLATIAYFTALVNYKGARQATLQAAKDLYGNCSIEAETVVAAWDAVAVPSGITLGGIFACGSDGQSGIYDNSKNVNVEITDDVIWANEVFACPGFSVVVKENSSTVFKAGEQILLGAGFKVERNATFKAYTFECANAANYRVSNTNVDIDEKESANNNSIPFEPIIFPNPTRDKIVVAQLINFIGGNIEIINLMGQIIFSQSIQNHQMSFNLSEHPKGIYLVKISSDKQQIIEKIVLE